MENILFIDLLIFCPALFSSYIKYPEIIKKIGTAMRNKGKTISLNKN